MVQTANDSMKEMDLVLFVVDATAPTSETEREIAQNLKLLGVPAILVINKVDLVKKDTILPIIADFSSLHSFEAIIPVSAMKNDGVDMLISEIKQYMIEGPAFFPEDMVCDFPERFLAQEVIREKMLELLKDEVRHGVGVQIVKMQERANGKIYILADIFCERKSHKGIIIGKNGAMLRTIGTNARKELEELLEAGVFLELFVKIQEDWRNIERNLKQMGYTDM
jgi:GTP-binding protein Era